MPDTEEQNPSSLTVRIGEEQAESKGEQEHLSARFKPHKGEEGEIQQNV